MGLKVWLPLNGDLRNQGTLNIIGTNYNSTVNTTGKIGSCYYFNGSNMRIEYPHDKTIWNDKEISICMWYKWAEGNTTCCVVDIAADLCLTYGYSSSKLRFSYWRAYSNSGGTRTGDSNATGYIYDSTQWHHVVYVCDHNMNYIYVDGELALSINSSSKYTTNWKPLLAASYNKITIGKSAGSSSYASGYVNDVRIYDHALSAAEVKEISQGLVLHYKLDSIDVKTGTNLVTGITKGGQTTLLTDGRIGVETSGANADTYFVINLSESIVAGTSYFLSCDASGISTGQYWGFPLGQQGNSTLPFKIYNGHNEYAFTANDTLPNGNAMNWGTNRLFMDDNSRSDWANKAQFYNFQLVKIGAGTELMVEDSSGYNHNGILNDTTAKILSDTQRHSAALVTSQAANSSIYPIKGECNMPESAALTFTWWMKPTTIGHQTSGIFSTSNNDLPTDYNTTAANMRDSYFDCCNTSGTCVRINVASYLTLNEWHHYALTYNGSQLNFYKDGVSKATVSQSGSLKAFKYIFPFYSKAGGANRTTSGGLSDFRIYCTALDANAIRQLYQVGAKIDNKQNWHTFEFIEGTDGNTKITKSGQTVVQGNLVNNQYYNGLIEDGDKVKINSNKTITAAEFIEA